MKQSAPNEYYFALGRLLARWRGGSAVRSEKNWREGYAMGVVMYAIGYLAAVHALSGRLVFWQLLLALPLLLGALWIVWLIVIYANSLVVRACWAIGLCTDLSRRRVQSVLLGIETTICAAWFLGGGSWLRWIGLFWIAAIGLNLAAALLLAIWYDERS